MKRAILTLEQLSDIELFETLSEGIQLIVDNVTRLDKTARSLCQVGEYRASEVMRGHSDEEAAKVLLLIDYVRCPKELGKRAQLLNYFYNHVSKRVYAKACEYPRIASFGEFNQWMYEESRPYYFDGPKQFDWIFPNDISTEREQALYVNYVDLSPDLAGFARSCEWIAPPPDNLFPSQHKASKCVSLITLLLRAGVLSAHGIAEIADVWRKFEPQSDTTRDELQVLIAKTLNRLAQSSCTLNDEQAQFIISHWPFPLRPEMEITRQADGGINDLRQERKRAVQWIEETEARRDPPPAISPSTVELLSETFAVWKREADEVIARAREVRLRSTSKNATDGNLLPFTNSEDIRKTYELASFSRIQKALAELSDKERAALVALALFTREQIANWPRTYSFAIKRTPHLDDWYQISLGSEWLPGLRRWQSKPLRFSAGRTYFPDFA